MSEILDWQAEYALEPWGDIRVDLAGASVASMVANAGGGKKGGGQFTPAELMPRWGEAAKPRPRKTWKYVMATLKGYTIASGGTVNGKPTRKERRKR